MGLIGEEVSGSFKTYHFDYRGSTVAITDSNCNITDTFEYDTYGNLTARTGTTKTPFLYNGRDGVMYEDDTGLIYMRARYYCPTLRRFVNADKLHGDITNALTLNRYSFCNGDPANGIDPMGLSAERGSSGNGTHLSKINTPRLNSNKTNVKNTYNINLICLNITPVKSNIKPVNVVAVSSVVGASLPAAGAGAGAGAAGWAASMSWLPATDGILPYGDAIYLGGILVLELLAFIYSIKYSKKFSDHDNPPTVDYPGDDPTTPPNDDYKWEGKEGGEVGGPDGTWKNDITGEQMHPDLNHKPPVNPHYDYYRPDVGWWRLYRDGAVKPKY